MSQLDQVEMLKNIKSSERVRHLLRHHHHQRNHHDSRRRHLNIDGRSEVTPSNSTE